MQKKKKKKEKTGTQHNCFLVLERRVLHRVKPKHTDAQRLKRRVFHKAKALQLG